MASAIYSEIGHSDQGRRLSLSVDSPASASPFPSPSSSFLPPPTPGAHEFAVKPPPAGRNGRKSSNAHVFKKEDEANGMIESKSTSQRSSVDAGVNHVNGSAAKSPTPSSPALSPSTPTTSSLQRHVLMNNHENSVCASTPLATTPTAANTHIPEPPTNGTHHPNPPPITIPDLMSPPSQTTPSQNLSSGDVVLTPNRPAPPSPAMSRRVSGAPSTYSTRSKSSRPPSAAVSRTNSLRKTAGPSSPTNRRFSQLSSGHYPTSSSPLASPLSGTFPNIVASPPPVPVPQVPSSSARVRIKIRDFAFDMNDERHSGAGPHVPKANRVGRLNKQLGASRMSTGSIGSWESSDGGEEEDEEDASGGGWDGFRMSMGRFSWNVGAGAAPAGKVGEDGYPSKNDLARNFFAAEGEEEDDIFIDAVEGDDEEEPLYPGLYRALYAFEPEGTAEMALEEDQIVRVVGRGGGVGWALVLDERAGQGESIKHALVPESYLEPIRFDYEDEQAAVPE